MDEKSREKREPYLLPCGNDYESCFLQIIRGGIHYCRVYKKIIWGTCRHRKEDVNNKWVE